MLRVWLLNFPPSPIPCTALSIQFDPVIYTVTEGASGMLRLVIIGQAGAPVSVSLSTGQRLDTASGALWSMAYSKGTCLENVL